MTSLQQVRSALPRRASNTTTAGSPTCRSPLPQARIDDWADPFGKLLLQTLKEYAVERNATYAGLVNHLDTRLVQPGRTE